MATIDDVFAQNEQIIATLALKGFRRLKPTNQDVLDTVQILLNEVRAVKKEIRQNRSPGGLNASNNPNQA